MLLMIQIQSLLTEMQNFIGKKRSNFLVIGKKRKKIKSEKWPQKKTLRSARYRFRNVWWFCGGKNRLRKNALNEKTSPRSRNHGRQSPVKNNYSEFKSIKLNKTKSKLKCWGLIRPVGTNAFPDHFLIIIKPQNEFRRNLYLPSFYFTMII